MLLCFLFYSQLLCSLPLPYINVIGNHVIIDKQIQLSIGYNNSHESPTAATGTVKLSSPTQDKRKASKVFWNTVSRYSM